jgi:quercetin dioxygenase-like cupin family protein
VTKRQLTFVVAGAAVFAAVAGTARATSSSGVVSAAIQARAAFADPVDIKFKVGAGEVIHVRESRDTVMQKIVLGPGGHTGWHSHHGPAVVLVKAGALTLFSGDDPTCTGRTYPAGQAFVDSGQGHVHIGRNLSSTDDVELWVTYFDVPPPPGSVRVDVDDPGNCTF